MNAPLKLPPLNLQTVSPEIALMAASLAVLLYGLVSRRAGGPVLRVLTVLGIAVAGVLDWLLVHHPGEGLYYQVIVDRTTVVGGLVVLLSALLAVWLSAREVEEGPEYYALILWGLVGMLVTISAYSLLSLFLGIEILSLPLYILSGYHVHRDVSGEAGLKYLLLGAFSSGFLLYGMALLYGSTGSTYLPGIQQYFLSGGGTAGPLVLAGMALLLVGLAFKLAIIPFHMWVPDVYQGAPTPVTAFMSVGTKAAAFLALVRVLLTALPAGDVHWQPLLWFLAVLTMLGGNLMALPQTNLKRLLGYSGIAQAGYLLVALVPASDRGVEASLFYLVAYAFMNLGPFAVIAALSRGGEEGAELETYRGLFFRRPWLALAMTWFMLSLASIPPTAGFAGKVFILQAAIEGGDLVLAVALVVATMISLYVYLKVVRVMFLRGEEAPASLPERTSALVVAALVVAAWGTLQFGLFPSEIAGILHQAGLLAGF